VRISAADLVPTDAIRTRSPPVMSGDVATGRRERSSAEIKVSQPQPQGTSARGGAAINRWPRRPSPALDKSAYPAF
jgi:hypothetical protein